MFSRRCAILTILVASSAAQLAAVETVRIDATAGAPRLMIDGHPVRARMFFGRPGSRPLRIGPAGEVISFEFVAAGNEPKRATMHFRFGEKPGDVYLDDIRVQALDADPDVLPLRDFDRQGSDFAEDWTYWPPASQSTVGKAEVAAGIGYKGTAGLHVRLDKPPDGRWPDYHIYHHPNLALEKGRRYRVSLWARAEPARDLTIAFYRPGLRFTYLGGPPGPFASQIQLAADAGVNLVSFPVHMPWPKPGEPVDWSTAERQCQAVLEANPEALLLPRIGMGAPHWWRQTHPDDAMLWDTSGQERGDVVVASPTYRREAAERLGALVTHLEQKFGEHMAGYHPCGQNTGEWFYQETWKPALNGYSKASLQAWRTWLRQRYESDAALRQAWGDPEVTLVSVRVPQPEARRAAPHGILRDPHDERSLIDFAEFQQQMMADCVYQLAAAVRQASKGRKLVVFFYGYVFEFGAIRNGPAVSGHYALRRVLECPEIDVLCSPISYFDRGWGQSAPAMTAAESVALAGKMWLYEDDTATCLSTGTFPGRKDRVDTIEQTNSILVRNTAQCAVRNFGTWWMDLGGTGWFDDPRMWRQMQRLSALDERMLAEPTPYRPEIAAVIDEASMLRVAAGGDAVTRPGVYEARGPLARCGAPYGQYLLDDVVAGRVKAKLYIFLNAWCLTESQRKCLAEATRGAACIWCYAPGYHDGGKLSLDSMRLLTGFQLRPVTPPQAEAEPTKLGRQLGLSGRFGLPQAVQPLFAAVDAEPDEILAVYPDGTPAVALRKTGQGNSLFLGVPRLTPDLLRIAARAAGVHLYTDKDCNIYGNGPVLALHASEDGNREIDTGVHGAIVDLMTGKTIGQGPRFVLPLQRGETRVLYHASSASD